jgi:hypothetical protein
LRPHPSIDQSRRGKIGIVSFHHNLPAGTIESTGLFSPISVDWFSSTGVVVVGVVVGLVAVVHLPPDIAIAELLPKSFVRINTRPPLLEVNVGLIPNSYWYCMRYAIQTVADLETPISQCTSTDVPVSDA